MSSHTFTYSSTGRTSSTSSTYSPRHTTSYYGSIRNTATLPRDSGETTNYYDRPHSSLGS